MAETMPQSSPLSTPPSSHPQQTLTSSQQVTRWRSARDFPFELQSHVRNYFEEALFKKALDLLYAVVSSDASSSRAEVTIPPPEHIALIATLVTHPLMTTRTTSQEKWNEANAALRLLRLLHKTAGPLNSRFIDAFRFNTLYDITRDDEESDTVIRHPFAMQDSIWSLTDNLWSVIGWAMNCSCLPDMYAARWEHWQTWLDFMLDVLESDWQYHLANQSCESSMLWAYLRQTPTDTAQPRRVVRAIFADGSKTSLNEFREIFRRELKPPKQESDNVKKREAVDIDKEIYGDYLAQDDSDASSDDEVAMTQRRGVRTPGARRVGKRPSRQSLRSDPEDDNTTSTPPRHLGPPESIRLRLRLMQLLIHISSHPTLTSSRSTAFPDLLDMITLFVEFIKPLPLQVFQQFTSPSVSTPSSSPTTTTTTTHPLLTPDFHTTLLESLLQRLLETTSSTTLRLEPLTQARLVSQYLPYAASKSTLDANARVSLCIEALLRNLARVGFLSRTQALEEAVTRGIERRMSRVKDRREKVKKGAGSEDEVALGWLVESSARMRSVLARLKG